MTTLTTTSRHLLLCVCALAMLPLMSCADEATESAPVEEMPISTGPEIPGLENCGQEYSVCGYLRVPSDFTGKVRSIAVALYKEIPPTASPDVLITEIDDPSIVAGELYPIRAYPFLDTGEYKLYIIVYMEGGGSARPANNIDYIGYIAESYVFDGQPIDFGEITLQPATDW